MLPAFPRSQIGALCRSTHSRVSGVPALISSGGCGNHGNNLVIGLGGNGPNDGNRGWNNRGGGNSEPWGRPMGAALLALSGMALAAGPAYARGKDVKEVIIDKDTTMTVEGVADMLWQLAGPIITNLGFSGCVGLMAGVALKKVGQMLAVIIGLVFVGMQGLAYQGFITVNYSNIQDTVTKVLDANHDGKLDEQDFKHYVNRGLGMLTAGVPSIGGFLAGFVMGLRM